MKTCGVYEILNVTTTKRYIGSSVDIGTRWKTHMRSLQKGIHHCIHLQRAWDKYGSAAFTFRVVLECTSDERCSLEQAGINQTQPDLLYNVVRDNIQAPPSRLGKHNTPAQNAAIGKANSGRPSWNKGGHNTWAKKAAASRVGKFDHQVLAENEDGRVVKFACAADAARGLGLVRKSVGNILNGRATRTRSGWTFRLVPKE